MHVCPVCQSEKIKDFIGWSSADEHRTFKKCCNCTHVFAVDFSSAVLDEIYNKVYYDIDRPDDIQKWIDSNRHIWNEMLCDIFCYKNDIKSILDFGAGSGGFLECLCDAKKSVIEIFGIETAAAAVENLQKRFPDGHFFTALSEIKQNEFDCITVLQCFEHLDNPLEICRELHEKLSEDGIMVITVPNRFSLRTLLKGRKDEFNVGNQTHLQFFSCKTMFILLKNSGFSKIKRVSNYPSDGTWLNRIVKYICRKFAVSSELRYICSK